MTEKCSLRKTVQQINKSLSDEYFASANERILRRVLSFPGYINASSVFIYLSTPREPETSRIVQNAFLSGKTVFVPKCVEENKMLAVRIVPDCRLIQNRYGIPEPLNRSDTANPEQLDLIVVPCVSANESGARLGHGGGFYDRYLAETDAVRLCLCFEKLLSDRIPLQPHDMRMDYLITERKTVKCR